MEIEDYIRMYTAILSAALLLSNPKTEIQVNLCGQFSTLEQQLEISKWEKKNSVETFYIENKNLGFYNQGWVFKVSIEEKSNTAVVVLKKNESLNPEEDSGENDEKLKCEQDLHGNEKKIGCKLSYEISIEKFKNDVNSQKYSNLLSPEQRAWLKKENTELPGSLTITSAFTDRNYVIQKDGLKITLGLTLNAKEQEFIEISTRSDDQNEKKDQLALLDYLKFRKVQLCTNQNSIMAKLKLQSFFD